MARLAAASQDPPPRSVGSSGTSRRAMLPESSGLPIGSNPPYLSPAHGRIPLTSAAWQGFRPHWPLGNRLQQIPALTPGLRRHARSLLPRNIGDALSCLDAAVTQVRRLVLNRLSCVLPGRHRGRLELALRRQDYRRVVLLSRKADAVSLHGKLTMSTRRCDTRRTERNMTIHGRNGHTPDSSSVA